MYMALQYTAGCTLPNSAAGGGNLLLLLHSCNQWHCNACNTDDTTTIFAIVVTIFKIKIIMNYEYEHHMLGREVFLSWLFALDGQLP